MKVNDLNHAIVARPSNCYTLPGLETKPKDNPLILRYEDHLKPSPDGTYAWLNQADGVFDVPLDDESAVSRISNDEAAI